MINVQAYVDNGEVLEAAPRNAENAVAWQIRYPGQVYSCSPLELHAGARMNSFQVDLIASALARVYEAGRQAAFAELRRLIGA